ncbi:DUF4329 domain-containing protein [Frateuria sp. MAH-13]|uniref:DUF4329 domain-containing protein n=1 Tax=Frateuria flava TaxID=2821489 RepID=A0ABS4DQM2_9GAMM|nr:DUF4329 domain-containing protein [Frateuria flava]
MKASGWRGAAWARVAAVVLTMLSLCWGGPAPAAETTTYVLTDVQGTVLAREDAQGNIIARYDYRPYGRQQAGPVATGPGYTGHVEDPDTGLVYMQQRYYDPEIGTFASIDPHPVLAGEIFFFNRYLYARGAPSRYVDSFGDKPGDKFSTAEEAARDALTYINQTSIATNHEYQGWIVLSGSQFIATDPMQISETGGPGLPPGVASVVGDYHTRGNYSVLDADGNIVVTGRSSRDHFNSDMFSPNDILRYQGLARNQPEFQGFVGTPGGRFLAWYKNVIYRLPNLKQNSAEEQERIYEEQRKKDEERKESSMPPQGRGSEAQR